jgi:hypothetical protein
MERVQALAEKFKNQLAQNANKSELRQTVLLILSELEPTPTISNYPNNVSVILPYGSSDQIAIGEPVIIAIPEIKLTEKPKEIMVEEVEVKKEMKEVLIEVKIESKEVAEHIALEPIKDLKAAIGINDKFQFIQELFGGDEKDFESSLKTINAFNIYAEAQFWIKKELRIKHNWEEESTVVKAFDQLIKRRFS